MDLNPRPNAPEPKRSPLADLLVLGAIVAVLLGLIEMGRQFHHPFQGQVDINLSPWMLPFYTMLSFMRGATAYILSFIFTLVYARWAAYDRQAERFLIPLLDILQSLPLSAFLVPVYQAMVAIFPTSNLGIELSCIIVIFTGQVWNMTFSFYYSLKGLPDDFKFVGQLARFTPWQRFTQIELPFATKGLVYNSMVSVAGGWFFLSLTEAFQLGNQDYRVKGVGSYMSVAHDQNNGWAQFYAVVAIIIMIVAIDQLIWRPLIVWSNKFKLEDTEAEFQERSAVLRFLSRSRVVAWIGETFGRIFLRAAPPAAVSPATEQKRTSPLGWIPWYPIFLVVCSALVVYGAWGVARLLWEVKPSEWLKILVDLLLTLIRVLCTVGISTLIAVPVGVWIGGNPKVTRYVMPITQIAASFPAPMIFVNLVMVIYFLHGNLEWGSVVLMIFGAIWYIVFNVISGASAVPQDLRACTQLTHLTRWQQWRTLWLPGIFPALTTGWITAAGGAWNASIASEYVQYGNKTLTATGLGAYISQAQANNNFPGLAASVLSMAIFVVIFNRFVWKRLSAYAQERYQLIT
ncbi:MAG TPA: ABC transporter permease subunit [Candidatus Methylacidiphilales bacterium]|jgi:NitT/TauT family transport system permease protein|nr:ABC transporter permease subunit [Candidatus Methylacidiphilales bacterium]